MPENKQYIIPHDAVAQGLSNPQIAARIEEALRQPDMLIEAERKPEPALELPL